MYSHWWVAVVRVQFIQWFSRSRGTLATETVVYSLVKSSLYINNRQPYGSLSNVLRKLT